MEILIAYSLGVITTTVVLLFVVVRRERQEQRRLVTEHAAVLKQSQEWAKGIRARLDAVRTRIDKIEVVEEPRHEVIYEAPRRRTVVVEYARHVG